jgi:hypothetical protein
MRDLDNRAQNIMQEIDLQADEFLKMSRAGNGDRKKELAAHIQVQLINFVVLKD